MAGVGKVCKFMSGIRGEPLVHKVALLSKYAVLPAAMIAAIAYSPPSFGSSKK